MTTITQKTATDGQLKSLLRKGADATEKAIRQYFEAGITKEGAQRVDESPEFVARIHAATVLALVEISTPQEFKDEEVPSTYGYLSGYEKPKDVSIQSNQLRVLFPGVGFHDEKAAQMAMPKGAEGLFVIPTWQSFAKLHHVTTYAEAVRIVLAKLKETRNGNFYNYRENEMDSAHLRETARKAEAMATIAEQQKGSDLLVIPAQFGIVHRGRSVRRARVVIGGKGFGLGAFEVGIMLLLHPERLANYDDLWIDCAGDEFKPSDEREFSLAPIFGFFDGKLRFDAFRVAISHDNFGSASAFLPQE